MNDLYLIVPLIFTSVGGVKVSIVAFQAIDPGSIPGWRTFWGASSSVGKLSAWHQMIVFEPEEYHWVSLVV